MRLDRLLNEVDVFDRPDDARRIDVTKLTETLNDVGPGAVFFCVVGSKHDGHEFAQAAAERGAVAVIVEREVDVPIPYVRVSNVRAAMAPMASAFYDFPARRMRMVGITGTNGKTTTTSIMREIMERHRWNTGLVGTLTGSYTTPPAIALQEKLAAFRDDHVNAVVMEVSSSALAQNRVDGIRFDVGVFTNLTQDHLDYHGTMAKYFEAKASLFEPGRVDVAVVNVDDEWGRKLVDRLAVPLEPYSLSAVRNLRVGSHGSDFEWQEHVLHIPLLGTFNVYNALAAATAARSMGVPVETIDEALRNLGQVPGRMEIIRKGQPFAVVVDFAHTPDGLDSVLKTARTVVKGSGRLLVAFGCGGDRDRDKRGKMGAIAETLADDVVLTSDNPRSEDPADILNDIMSGMRDSSKAHVYVDRREAIQQVVAHATDGDVVVIAGKGHETMQEIRGVRTPFDDRIVAADAVDRWLSEHGHRSAS